MTQRPLEKKRKVGEGVRQNMGGGKETGCGGGERE